VLVGLAVRRLYLLFALTMLPCGARAEPLGQWVWSRADLARLAEARRVRPDIAAAVSVAELRVEAGQVRVQLRHSPRIVPAQAAVIRLDDSFHAALDTDGPELTNALAAALGRVLALVPPEDAPALQLDYDCPVHKLARWAGLLRALTERGLFEGRSLWITSLVAQLREPRFGALFAEIVAGHIVQVFDTGERAMADAEPALLALVTRAGLPFALGLGAFERTHGTDHAAFWELAPGLAKSPLFRGTWVFAAGQRWDARARSLP